MSLHHTTSAQSQADAAKKEAERIKSRCSNAEQSQQQLFEQLLQAEAGLRCSRETNSMLLAEGKKLELQVNSLACSCNSAVYICQPHCGPGASNIVRQSAVSDLKSEIISLTTLCSALCPFGRCSS